MADQARLQPPLEAVPYFVRHGHFCARRPMEVIAATTTITVFLFSYAVSIAQRSILTNNGLGFTFWPTEFVPVPSRNQDIDRLRLTLLTFVRCLSLLYCYYQLRMVQRSHSKSVAGITGLFALVSAIVFSSGLVNIFHLSVSELGDAILFYLIWMDLSRASHLIRLGFRSTSKVQLASDLASTIGRLGPLITFDSVVQVLVISVGMVSGMRQLEILCSLALLAIVTNYTIFMTVFPASMCVITELLRKTPGTLVSNLTIGLNATASIPSISSSSSSTTVATTTSQLDQQQQPQEPSSVSPTAQQLQQRRGSLPTLLIGKMSAAGFDQFSNINSVTPVLKLVIGASFLLFQSCGYWSAPTSAEFTAESQPRTSGVDILEETMLPLTNGTDEASELSDAYSKIISYLFLRFDQLVISSLLLVLAIKYIFYDDKNETSVAGEHSSAPIQRVLPVVNKKSKSGRNSSDNSDDDESEEVNSGNGLPRKLSHSLPSSDRLRGISFTVGESDSDNDLESSRKPNVVLDSKEIQTLDSFIRQEVMERNESLEKRSLEECNAIYDSIDEGAKCLTDAEVISLVDAKRIPAYQLEKAVQDEERGVSIRRKLVARANPSVSSAFDEIPFRNYDYSKITGACCENVVGYIPVPVGVVGPLNLDGKTYQVPMATTEGCLVASTNRGCRALCNGVRSRIVGDGMSRGPVVRFPNAMRSSDAAIWLSDPQNFEVVKESFDGSSRFARLQKVTCRPAGRYLFVRFVAKTGDAMGMNMISKGTEVALNTLQTHFPDMEILSLSGNFCTDKKPAAVNWIEGRGKSVVSEAVVPAHIVHNVLKTSSAALVELNVAKNLVGSAVAGSIGGFNAHAANIVAAIYIATGQDAAQCVGSSNCITLMETWGVDGQDLYISCTMPSIEVGTIGGGTCLPAQSACLSVLGIQGPHVEEPGKNARDLARVVCATVLAGELSLMSALAAGHLVRSHLKHNRSSVAVDRSMSTTCPVTFPSPPPPFPQAVTTTQTLLVNQPRPLLVPPPPGGSIINKKNDLKTQVADISLKTSSTLKSIPKEGSLKVKDISSPKSITKENMMTTNNHATVVEQPRVPYSHAVPPPTSMDFLSVPTECKQF